MSLTVNLCYAGAKGSARLRQAMGESGLAAAIRAEDGSERHEYFFPMNDAETVLLIDRWRDQAALDRHHASPMMKSLAALREKYDLHMRVERYAPLEEEPGGEAFIRK